MNETQALDEMRGALIASSTGHEAEALRLLELAGAPGDAEYAEHRALAFVYQWCFLIEQPPSDPAALRELIGEPVKMRLSEGGELTTFDEIARWHDATSHAVAVTTHTLVGFELSQPTAGRYDVTVDFAWQGITSADQAMRARTHHEWTLADADERFPRLTSFVVTAVEPFAPVTAVAALEDLRSVTSRAA
jgi:hypothetical protein